MVKFCINSLGIFMYTMLIVVVIAEDNNFIVCLKLQNNYIKRTCVQIANGQKYLLGESPFHLNGNH